MIDFVLFESFRLDNHVGQPLNTYFFADNLHNATPRIAAEMSRADGFRVLSLGYAEGPPDEMSVDTLLGLDNVGFDSLMTDIEVTHGVGFRHYLTNRPLNVANTFVLDHASYDDHAPPEWTSTWNDRSQPFPIEPVAPTPRVGVQEAVGAPGAVLLRWDVALDLHRVGYAAYFQTEPFDFASPDPLAGATRRVLSQDRHGPRYELGPSPTAFPYEAVVPGLTPGVEYHFLIRAFRRLAGRERGRERGDAVGRSE